MNTSIRISKWRQAKIYKTKAVKSSEARWIRDVCCCCLPDTKVCQLAREPNPPNQGMLQFHCVSIHIIHIQPLVISLNFAKHVKNDQKLSRSQLPRLPHSNCPTTAQLVKPRIVIFHTFLHFNHKPQLEASCTSCTSCTSQLHTWIYIAF